jgi:hypothetical protein
MTVSNRFRPGQGERQAADNDRAALARAVIDGQQARAVELAKAELQRQADRNRGRTQQPRR